MTMACVDIVNVLNVISKQIQDWYNQVYGLVNTQINQNQDRWTVKKTGKEYTFEQTLTYTGSTATVNLQFDRRMSVKRIDQIWDDATAKDIDVRIYSDASSVLYAVLLNATTNTDTSKITSALTESELSFAPNGKLQFVYANNTVAKICKIVVIAEEL
jgi:hypothetical protein